MRDRACEGIWSHAPTGGYGECNDRPATAASAAAATVAPRRDLGFVVAALVTAGLVTPSSAATGHHG